MDRFADELIKPAKFDYINVVVDVCWQKKSPEYRWAQLNISTAHFVISRFDHKIEHKKKIRHISGERWKYLEFHSGKFFVQTIPTPIFLPAAAAYVIKWILFNGIKEIPIKDISSLYCSPISSVFLSTPFSKLINFSSHATSQNA